MGEMEYMKKKKIRAAIYCRVGNPADAGIAVEHTSGHDDTGRLPPLQDRMNISLLTIQRSRWRK